MRVKRMTQLGTLVLVTIGAFIIGVRVRGQGEENQNSVIPFDEVRMIIEVNDTDGDAGLQIFLDGEDWKQIEIFGPDGQKIFAVEGQGSLGEHGTTELFIESAEPSFEDVPLEAFLLRFPAGEYRFVGQTVEGDQLVGTAMLTHAIPEGPVLVSPEEDAVINRNRAVIKWNSVADPPGSKIVEYQVIVEREDPLREFSVRVPATVTSVTVPPEFLEPNTEYKFEALAIKAGGNQTISERSFETAR